MLTKHAPLLLRQVESDVVMATEKLQLRIKGELSKKIIMSFEQARKEKVAENNSVSTITQLQGIGL
jgi:hypothetical protein